MTSGDIAPLLRDFARHPGVQHALCAYISRTGVTCKGIRSHSAGEVTFDVLMAPANPNDQPTPGLYTFVFDQETGQPKSAKLEPGA